MACFYEMTELKIPLKEETIKGTEESHHFYTMRVCKDCRADWMAAIKNWFSTSKQEKESCGSGIFVRKLGATSEITKEEWDKKQGNYPLTTSKDV